MQLYIQQQYDHIQLKGTVQHQSLVQGGSLTFVFLLALQCYMHVYFLFCLITVGPCNQLVIGIQHFLPPIKIVFRKFNSHCID